MKTKKTTNTLKRPFDLLVMWFKFRRHPCYIGNGEFDHELEVVNDSFDHEFGTEVIQYMQCGTCGATHDEDASIPESPEGFWDDSSEDFYELHT